MVGLVKVVSEIMVSAIEMVSGMVCATDVTFHFSKIWRRSFIEQTKSPLLVNVGSRSWTVSELTHCIISTTILSTLFDHDSNQSANHETAAAADILSLVMVVLASDSGGSSYALRHFHILLLSQ